MPSSTEPSLQTPGSFMRRDSDSQGYSLAPQCSLWGGGACSAWAVLCSHPISRNQTSLCSVQQLPKAEGTEGDQQAWTADLGVVQWQDMGVQSLYPKEPRWCAVHSRETTSSKGMGRHKNRRQDMGGVGGLVDGKNKAPNNQNTGWRGLAPAHRPRSPHKCNKQQEAVAVALFIECWPSMHGALGSVPAPHKQAWWTPLYPSTWEVGAGGPGVQGYPQLPAPWDQPRLHESLSQEEKGLRPHYLVSNFLQNGLSTPASHHMALVVIRKWSKDSVEALHLSLQMSWERIL